MTMPSSQQVETTAYESVAGESADPESLKITRSKPKKIDTLQALRCFAFLGIFLFHAIGGTNGLGRWGVSVFFVLSGFVLVYSYLDRGRITSTSLKDNFQFAAKKIQPLYPLYVVLTLLVAAMTLATDHALGFIKWAVTLVLNLLLITPYAPIDSELTFISPAWFLTTIILGYFLFPWVLKWMEKSYTKRKAMCMIALSIGIIALLGWLGTLMPNTPYDTTQSQFWVHNFIGYFVYRFPFVRIWDIFIGCNLGYLFVRMKAERGAAAVPPRWLCTLLECIAIVMIVVSLALYAKYYPVGTIGHTAYPPVSAWWLQSLIWIFSSILLVYVFALDNGVISKLLTNKVTLYIARLSPYLYLVQTAVFRFLKIPSKLVLGIANPFAAEQWYIAIPSLIVALLLAMLAAEIWIHLERWAKQWLANRKTAQTPKFRHMLAPL